MVFFLTHVAGRTLGIDFCAGQDHDEQDVEELSEVPFSWTDHCLVGFRLAGTRSLWAGVGRQFPEIL